VMRNIVFSGGAARLGGAGMSVYWRIPERPPTLSDAWRLA
jgi:hypothetical protein